MNQKKRNGFSEILSSVRNDVSKRLAAKVPQWAEFADNLTIPRSINLEQCTCGAAAGYKATLIEVMFKGKRPRIADLTGGLGVDAWAFSKVASRVLHNERDAALSRTVASNFEILGVSNVTFSNFDVSAENTGLWLGVLREFAPDMIYLDPARRDSAGRKVFRPSDCSPDIVSLMSALLGTAGTVMVKFSPLVDITALRNTFGDNLKQIHIVSSDGEVKEVLCVFNGLSCRRTELFITGNDCRAGKVICVSTGAERGTTAMFPPSGKEFRNPLVLFEPGSGLMKAGLFKWISGHYGMTKLATSTHLYCCDTEQEELDGYGKFFRILDILPFDKSSIKRLSTEYPHADISARNIPLSSDELRKRMGMKAGANPQAVHIFATTVADGTSGRRVFFVTVPLADL